MFIDDFRPAPPGWQCEKTLSGALLAVFRALAQSEPIEAVSLDYCIAGAGREVVQVEGMEKPLVSLGDFYPVAQILAINSARIRLRADPKIYIHSDSPDGAADLFALLSKHFAHVCCVDSVKMYAFFCGRAPESHAKLPDPIPAKDNL